VAAFFSNIMGNSELLHKACKTAVEANSSFQAVGLTMYPPVPVSVEQELQHVPVRHQMRGSHWEQKNVQKEIHRLVMANIYVLLQKFITVYKIVFMWKS
jgi:hypothetical protein